MSKPAWFHVKVSVDITIKASTFMWLLHWITWTLLVVRYVLAGSWGHPPIF